MNKKLHIKNRLFNQVLAEPIVDSETGEVLAQKGEKLERKLLNKIIPYFEQDEDKPGEKHIQTQAGVLEEPIILQSIKVLDPTDPEGERELNIIGNAKVDESTI